MEGEEKEMENDSDVNSKDTYDEQDYYNDKNEEYKNTQPHPTIDPPKDLFQSTAKKNNYNEKKWTATTETYMNFDEKFQKINNNEQFEEEFPTTSAEEMCESYKKIYNANIDLTKNNYDTFSKNHLRNTLVEKIKNLNWEQNEKNVNEAKKETNAYEDIREKFFEKKQGYQLANINYLFDKELIKYDNICEGIIAFLVGDNGGLSDFILYNTIYRNKFSPTIFAIPEKNNSIKEATFRKETKDKVNDCLNILNEYYEEGKDFDDNSKLSLELINDIAEKINQITEGNMVNLFVARKVLDFSPDSSQEVRYKKFLLTNTLVALKLLTNNGHFIIKLYDTFTPFTIGIIYLIFKNFENITVFKPVTTRQYSSARFLIAENYLKDRNDKSNSIKYLENYFNKYIEFASKGYDVTYFLPINELRKNEKFLAIIPQINNDITEKRIDAINEMINYIEKRKVKLYDKLSIKKFFLDRWGVPVINYDEKKLIKNQNFFEGGSSHYSVKHYTESELIEKYEDVGKFDDEQLKMLELIDKVNKKPVKTKKKSKENKIMSLEERYKRAEEKISKPKKSNKSEKKVEEAQEDEKLLSKKTKRDDGGHKDKKKKERKKSDENNNLSKKNKNYEKSNKKK